MDSLLAAYDEHLDTDECKCPFCGTWRLSVTFSRLPAEVWPEGRDACDGCYERIERELSFGADVRD